MVPRPGSGDAAPPVTAFHPGEGVSASAPAPPGADREPRRVEETGPASGLEELVDRNPMLAAASTLLVGLIVGMLIGAAVARD